MLFSGADRGDSLLELTAEMKNILHLILSSVPPAGKVMRQFHKLGATKTKSHLKCSTAAALFPAELCVVFFVVYFNDVVTYANFNTGPTSKTNVGVIRCVLNFRGQIICCDYESSVNSGCHCAPAKQNHLQFSGWRHHDAPMA